MSARNNRLPSATMSAYSNGEQWTSFSRCISSSCIINIAFHYFIFAGAIEIFGFIVLAFFAVISFTRYSKEHQCVYIAVVDYKSLLYHYIKSACCCLSFALTRVTSHPHSFALSEPALFFPIAFWHKSNIYMFLQPISTYIHWMTYPIHFF